MIVCGIFAMGASNLKNNAKKWTKIKLGLAWCGSPIHGVVVIGVVCVRDEVGGEQVDSEAVPPAPGPGDPLADKDFAVKVPE